MKIEVRHLLEQVRGRRASCHRDADWIGKTLGFFGVAEEGIDCWCGVEVCDAFFFEQAPDLGVVDLAKAEMGSTDGCDSPWEGPSYNTFNM